MHLRHLTDSLYVIEGGGFSYHPHELNLTIEVGDTSERALLSRLLMFSKEDPEGRWIAVAQEYLYVAFLSGRADFSEGEGLSAEGFQQRFADGLRSLQADGHIFGAFEGGRVVIRPTAHGIESAMFLKR